MKKTMEKPVKLSKFLCYLSWCLGLAVIYNIGLF